MFYNITYNIKKSSLRKILLTHSEISLLIYIICLILDVDMKPITKKKKVKANKNLIYK